MRSSLLILGALCALPLSAAPRKKPEKPAQALKRVTKAFAKLKSYRADVTVKGGMAKGHTHLITQGTVDDAYAMTVLGKLTRLQGPVLGYRLRGQVDGAAQVGQQWKKLLTPKEGRSMTRLCAPPEALLAEAMRLKRHARYEDSPGSSGGSMVLGSVANDDDDGTRTERSGGSSKAKGEEELGPQPRHIVIEASGSVAVEHFERVLSSGCLLSGG